MIDLARWGVYLALALLAMLAVAFFGLGFHRPPTYIQNFEMDEYGSADPFLEPLSVVDGLAIYSIGEGEPVLLIPYPHGHTTEPMAQGPMARMLVDMGRRVVTFDVPGAYRSTREPDGTMTEMIQAADETLEQLGIEEPVDVVGHSMSGFVALAYAVERPERTRRLVLANSVSGFPAAARCGYPGSAFNMLDADYWRIILWGIRVNAGRADLATHKRLQNLMAAASYHDERFFAPLAIDASDRDKGVPIRMIWSKNMYTRLCYADRLDEVTAPTLVLAGQHDPEAGLACAHELYQGVDGARLIIFEESGHAPFIEEADQFAEAVGAFLDGGDFALDARP